jgi:hypothetical protein
VDRQASHGIHVWRDVGVILGGAPQSVLGGQESHEPSPAPRPEKADGVLEPSIDGGLVGQETEALSAEESRAAVSQNVKTGVDTHRQMVASRRRPIRMGT